MPSIFLNKRAKRMQGSSAKGKAKLFTYERDIICLPKSFPKKGCIQIPRGQEARQFLAQNRLIGKISLSSSMSEEEIYDEIASVFSDAMGGDIDFPFTILQPAGGASKSLVIPSLSSSFKWTASTVAGKNAKVPIYILAGRDLKIRYKTKTGEDSDEMAEEEGKDQRMEIKEDKQHRKRTVQQEDKELPEVAFTKQAKISQQTNSEGASSASTSKWGVGTSYDNYIDLLSDSSEEGFRTPTPPPLSLSPLSQPLDTSVSLSELLWNHRLAVLPDDPDDKHRIKVRRRAVWEDTLHQLRKGLPVTKHLRVTFLGEPAVDAGGPLREYLHLLVASVARNNSLFVGEETSRAPAHNISAVEHNTYYYVGIILAMSIVHGGPAPCFFTNAVADFILYGLEITRPTIEDVPDQQVRVKLQKLQKVSTTEGLRELLDSDEFDFRYTCGLAQPSSNLEVKDRARVVASFAKHFSIMYCMTELIQLKEGMGALNVLDFLRSHHRVARPLLVFSPAECLIADRVYDMFQADLSPVGSNRRETEEFVYMQWVSLMEEIGASDGTVQASNNEVSEVYSVTLKDVLMFSTGATSEPPLGLQPSPMITFQSESPLPTSNTCTNTLSLPTQHRDFETFKYHFLFGITNAAGFGQL